MPIANIGPSMFQTDRIISTRQRDEPCVRCHHTAGQHHLGQVRSWEYCLASECLCPGWCSTLDCATCDHGTSRWAGYSQCLACLYYWVKPSDYVVKAVIGFDADAARVSIQAHRQEWEVKHPGWHLELDRQRIWPESAARSRHADRHTTLARKKYDARFRVVRAYPRLRTVSSTSSVVSVTMRIASLLSVVEQERPVYARHVHEPSHLL